MITRALVLAGVCLLAPLVWAEQPKPSWQEEVRKFAEIHDWNSAMQIINREAASAPHEAEVIAWRARVLAWSGNLPEAELQYKKLVLVAPNDPDTWAGLANIYARTGRSTESLAAFTHALQLDPDRIDIRLSYAFVLRRAGQKGTARSEFHKILTLDPANREAQNGLRSLRSEPKHNLSFGFNNDLFNFAGPNHDEEISVASRWSERWQTVFGESSYQRSGINGTKFLASLARISARWGALTIGGAVARDNGVIPQHEAFFDYDRGWRLADHGPVRGVELVYGQHWYWYSTAQILTLNQTAIFYLPRDWTWSFRLTGARSDFSGLNPEWRPSGMSKLDFPIYGSNEPRLIGSVLFATGTEDFAEIDQIGRFSSQTYGGGLRLRLMNLQEIGGIATYQKRTQGRTDISFGFTYGIRF